MNIWISSMECAGIAEAGGVKNVTYSLCKELSLAHNSVTLFIPYYKCTDISNLVNIKKDLKKVEIIVCGKKETVSFTSANIKACDFSVIFINHKGFSEKEAVYTYTENEQKCNPSHIKGKGHEDTLFLDVLYSKAVAAWCNKIKAEEDLPDLIHCQDASTALVPVFISQYKKLKNIKTVVTIHNAGPAYHHNFNNLSEAEFFTDLESEQLCGGLNKGKVEPFLLSHNYGSFISTVSEYYAEELLSPSNSSNTEGLSDIFFQRKIQIKGITNGFDFERYDPKNTEISFLPFTFDPEKNELSGKYKCRQYFLQRYLSEEIEGITPYGFIDTKDFPADSDCITYFVYHGRITEQKGLSVLISSIPTVINNHNDIRFIIMGQGQSELENQLIKISQDYPGKILFLNGYNKTAARLTTVSGDFIILPSNFEPCGLEDFAAQVYGTIPVAHRTGGLNKIIDYKTGFLYDLNLPYVLISKIEEVHKIKKENKNYFYQLILSGAKNVHENYLWKNVVEKQYIKYFKEILKKS